MLRIIDANLNRAREGLRVLEDVARLALNDVSLSSQLKDLRHRLSDQPASVHAQLLSARDSGNDVGAAARPSLEQGRPDLPSLVTANARRVEESLRVLEEACRLPETASMDWEAFQRARFSLYDIEKRLSSAVLRHDCRRRIRGLYLVLDTEALRGRKEVDVARQAIRGGASMVQLRDKRKRGKELLALSGELHRVCREEGALFVLNDYLDVAMALGIGCLHLGQEDMPLDAARRLLPVDMMLGGTTRTVERAQQAQAQGVDYIAVGSMFQTRSKHDTVVVGPQMLRRVRQAVTVPLVAIGGIDRHNVAEVVRAGADAIAVITAVMGPDDAEQAAREMVTAIEQASQDVKEEAAHS